MKQKRITLTLDSATAARAEAKAAERKITLSDYIGEVLRKDLCFSYEYEQAMKRYFAQKPVRMKRRGDRFLTREEVHDRARLRRQ